MSLAVSQSPQHVRAFLSVLVRHLLQNTSDSGQLALDPAHRGTYVVEEPAADHTSDLDVRVGLLLKGEGATGGALLTLKDLDKMHGQPPDAMRAKVTVKAEGMDRAVGSGVSGGGGRSQRNTIVREVMQKHGLSLPQASKYVKENNLY